MIATQLAQRLEELRYRMVVVATPAELVPRAEAEKPMVVLVDTEGQPEPVAFALQQLRRHPPTSHLPVICFARAVDDAMQAALATCGATMVVNEAAILSHLSQLLDHALDVH